MDTKIKHQTYNSADFKSLTEKERTVFRQVVDNLDERGLFSTADIPVIAGYARNVVLARTAAKDIEKLGTVIKFLDRGCEKYKTNPAVDIMNKAQMAYQDTAIKLGLTPTGAKRLKGEGKPKKSALEAFDEEFEQ